MTTPIGIDFENSHRLRGYITKPDRLYPLVLGAKSLRWEYKITLPSGYRIKQLPENIEFSNSVGQYSSHYETEQGAIRVQRLLSINSTVYNAEAYPAVQALLYKPINDVRQVMVLERKDKTVRRCLSLLRVSALLQQPFQHRVTLPVLHLTNRKPDRFRWSDQNR